VHGHSDVIISDEPVDYPELQGADLLVALCQWASDAYAPIVKPEGTLLYDADLVTRPVRFEGAAYALPLGRLAREAAGRSEPAPHLVALGAAVGITGVVSQESLLKTIQELELTGSKEARKRALAYGLALDPDEWRRNDL
jgi:2-oxoglutarate ferredoxin oxidoreductase subunit gamma